MQFDEQIVLTIFYDLKKKNPKTTVEHSKDCSNFKLKADKKKKKLEN